MKQLKKRQVEWFLTFANINFKSEYFDQMLYLIQNIKIFFGKIIHPDFKSILSELWDTEIAKVEMLEIEGKLKRLHAKTNKFLNIIFLNYTKAQKYTKEEGNFLDVMGPSSIIDLKTLYGMEIEATVKVMIRNSPKLEPIRRSPKPGGKIGTKQWRAFWVGKTLEGSPIELVITPKEGDDFFLFSFAEALDGISLASVKQCSECNNWLLQSGKRERRFCSNQCRAKEFNKERRKKIKAEGGEAYKTELKNGRKRAKASYKKRMQEKLGKNVKISKKV